MTARYDTTETVHLVRWLVDVLRVSVGDLSNHLRYVFTGPGVVCWFARPSADLDGKTPGALLDDPVRYPEVLSAVRRYRLMVAA